MVVLLLLVLVVALVAVAVIGFAGFGPLSSARREPRDGLLGTIGPAIGLLVGVGLFGVVAAAALLMGVEGDGATDHERRTATSAPSAVTRPAARRARAGADGSTTTTIARMPLGRRRATVGLGTRVRVEPRDGTTFPRSYDVADGLRSPTVLPMTVTGFEPFASATAAQCSQGVSQECGNWIPVQFDADGTASFQYLVTDTFLGSRPVPGGCRANAGLCTIVVRARIGGRTASIQTVFGDRVPPAGRISVRPASGLSLDGQRVRVRVRDFPAGSRVFAMLCAAPAATGSRCGAPGPAAGLVIRPDGTGSTELLIQPGLVGTDRVRCFRGDSCGVSVASSSVFARAPVVPISFAAPPGADYDSTRLVVGLGIALGLLLIAGGLLRRTDWSPVGEAAAPEIDDAEYADLDAMIAALPPEDELVH